MGPEIFESRTKRGCKRKTSSQLVPERTRSYSCSAVSPSQGLKLKLRRVDNRGRLEEKVAKVRRRIASKMATQQCYVDGCTLTFNGTDEADAKAKVNDHVIRAHEANAAEERRVYLANRQAEIVDGYVEKLRIAKGLGVETDQFMRLTGMQNGGFAGNAKTTKVEIPEWVKDQSFESWKIEFETYFDKVLGKYKGKVVKEQGQEHACEIRIQLEEKIRLEMIAMFKKCENESVKNFLS